MRSAALAASVLLAGCAASGTGPLVSQEAAREPSIPTSAQTEREQSAAEEDLEVMGEYEISAYADTDDEMECRAEAPLGSSIPVVRCYPGRAPLTFENETLDDFERQQIDEMRAQQLLEEQRRQAAEIARRRQIVQRQR